VNNWTDEKLELMVASLVKRKEREMGPRKVPDDGALNRMGNMVKVVKRGD